MSISGCFAGSFTGRVKTWIERIEVFGVKIFLNTAESLAKPLEVNNLPCTEKSDRIRDLRNVADYPENVIVG